MATSNTRSDDGIGLESDELSQDSAVGVPVEAVAGHWVNVLYFTVAGITAVGLLLVAFGAYFTPNDLLILIGGSITILGAVIWTVLAILTIVGMIRLWFTSDGKADKARPAARLE